MRVEGGGAITKASKVTRLQVYPSRNEMRKSAGEWHIHTVLPFHFASGIRLRFEHVMYQESGRSTGDYDAQFVLGSPTFRRRPGITLRVPIGHAWSRHGAYLRGGFRRNRSDQPRR